jgi:hypothetical protein
MKPGLTSNVGHTPFSWSSADTDMSNVAIMLAIINHRLVSAKCLPGQILFIEMSVSGLADKGSMAVYEPSPKPENDFS